MVNIQGQDSFLKVALLVLVSCNIAICDAAVRTIPLEGFNWYSEKPDLEKKKKDALLQTSEEKAEELPEYEKNIRALQEKHEKAHRQALDNPTPENLLAELKLEKEMMNKSRIYGEKRVAIAMLDSQFTNMKGHSNVLHRKVQEQVEDMENARKLVALSKEWGLVLQVQEACPHCHAFVPIILEFATRYGFEIVAATKDGDDFYSIEGVKDELKLVMFNPARETPMLYLIKNDGTEVLPISRGINSEEQIINNINAIDKHLRRLF